MSTGCPQAELDTETTIDPKSWFPGEIAACWQLAPEPAC
jgi:hypothetical protein